MRLFISIGIATLCSRGICQTKSYQVKLLSCKTFPDCNIFVVDNGNLRHFFGHSIEFQRLLSLTGERMKPITSCHIGRVIKEKFRGTPTMCLRILCRQAALVVSLELGFEDKKLLPRICICPPTRCIKSRGATDHVTCRNISSQWANLCEQITPNPPVLPFPFGKTAFFPNRFPMRNTTLLL